MKTLLLATLFLSAVTLARAGTPDISDEVNARIARTKSQQSALAAERLREGGAAAADTTVFGGASGLNAGVSSKGCNLAIGNVFEDKSRISTSARRETTVIVTGDVIQVGNNCH